ncbi:MAG: hypothetical protein JWR08_2645 [Enterovirga sp.]|nr:hypothetical protein [Enterovirga sp.]
MADSSAPRRTRHPAERKLSLLQAGIGTRSALAALIAGALWAAILGWALR